VSIEVDIIGFFTRTIGRWRGYGSTAIEHAGDRVEDVVSHRDIGLLAARAEEGDRL
jgi:hypothetical protein